ncbi:PepSY domain-containing protein [Loigolactobacillus coryniformis]|uniref:PepSY domain-containing protein n=3 Tax=Loigolactobacillus coryniformis TaxID=1610 RepID=A0A0R1F3F7_9LACO|nr:PepSY domain-containing protein [Loigolactobacillus coryniformis]OEH90363.1 hypothetical protein ATO00_04880 [Loigolactobacillus coryniformis subsp. coryniformis]RRG04984.1 MAG: hypothetical protein DUD28_07710 [Lactobacillus sp.]ATO43214.1 hypothetical protein LC20004_04545 [Loigolactobacillus coryniformis subsp. torquens DSM 20004 = KCTC 3535]ATO54985.1 hypothetical protein LC20001_04805 [Loigolactobacillus coryniformis subsp. coryniformis KCTC 3167 = DSM 20001]KRK16351.1 hypothetical pro
MKFKRLWPLFLVLLLLSGCGIVQPNTAKKAAAPYRQDPSQGIFTAKVSGKQVARLVHKELPHAQLLQISLTKHGRFYQYHVQARQHQRYYHLAVNAMQPIITKKTHTKLTKQNAERATLNLNGLKSLTTIKQIAISEINDGHIVGYTLARQRQITYYELLIHSRAHHTVRMRIDAKRGNILERQQVDE